MDLINYILILCTSTNSTQMCQIPFLCNIKIVNRYLIKMISHIASWDSSIFLANCTEHNAPIPATTVSDCYNNGGKYISTITSSWSLKCVYPQCMRTVRKLERFLYQTYPGSGLWIRYNNMNEMMKDPIITNKSFECPRYKDVTFARNKNSAPDEVLLREFNKENN